MCKFENNVERMSFENCNLFKRSYGTQGLGYTFNNEKEEKFIKKEFRSIFSHNTERDPSLMKSTNPDHSLTVVLDVDDNIDEEENGWNEEYENM